MQSRKPLRIDVPKEEGLRLGRVGLIAVVGFAVGIVWPRVAGMRLVPGVPSDKSSEPAGAELSGAPVDAGAPAPSAAAAGPAPSASSAPAVPSQELFSVGAGEVASCRDERGKKVERCDPVDFDVIARGRIATLAACDAAQRSSGVLSLGFELDFQKDRVTGLQSGKRTSLPQDDVDALLTCLKQNLGEVSLSGIHHEHERYTVYYRVEFAGSEPQKKAKPEASANVDVTPASGKATVAWDVALVRSQPAKDGEVVARVLSGTRVSVSGRNGDWYRIKYDAKGGEGWVFRTAIGM
jgi:hypothetical protein